MIDIIQIVLTGIGFGVIGNEILRCIRSPKPFMEALSEATWRGPVTTGVFAAYWWLEILMHPGTIWLWIMGVFATVSFALAAVDLRLSRVESEDTAE